MATPIQIAAKKQLVFEPGELPSMLVPRFRKFVETQMKWLRLRHQAGGGGREICLLRSQIADEVLKRLVNAWWPAEIGALGKVPFSLLAIGGYGRSEQNPGSDIDLLFLEGGGLIREDGSTPLSKLPPAIVQALYDMGLEPGARSVLTVGEAVKLAEKSMETKTSLLDVRLLAGDERLFKKLQAEVHKGCFRGQEQEYIVARLEDQARRRSKYGNTACLQEPNIKNGAGGLRDFQNLLWMLRVRFGVDSLTALGEHDLVSASERRELELAYDYELRVRTELHERSGRRTDTLTPNYQAGVAAGLGYTGDPRRRTEKFMRDYYTHARNIYLLTRTLEQRLALQPSQKKAFRLTGLTEFVRRRKASIFADATELDGFQMADGYLHLSERDGLKRKPERFIRAFLYAQQRGLTLHPDLLQLMRRQLDLVDQKFRRDPRTWTTFREILNGRGNVAPALRAMHEVGFLGRYLPEFGRLTNLVQHEYYHRYAVDEHTLVCIEMLDRVWHAEKPPFARYSDLLARLEQPWLLYLALLLHDAGKASSAGPHEIVGGKLALSVGRRIGIDASHIQTLRSIIELHLAMVRTAQQKDLEDTSVIAAFVDQVKDLYTLDLLTLHTFADSMGTSESLWTGFKDGLHRELHRRASDRLRGDTGQIRAEAARLRELREETVQLLPSTFAPDEIEAHFKGMPHRYFAVQTPREIARDLVLAHQFMYLQITEDDRALEPVVMWNDDPDRGHTTVRICTWDRAGLLAKITGAFSASSLNIHGAEIFTRADGISLDEFYVTAAPGGLIPEASYRARFEDLLRRSLVGEVELASLIAKNRNLRPLWSGLEGDSLPTVVKIDSEASADRTLIHVETENRVGLLFLISRTLFELKLDLIVAKILTEKGAAVDNFYVTEIGGGKVEDKDRQKVIVNTLAERIAGLVQGTPAA